MEAMEAMEEEGGRKSGRRQGGARRGAAANTLPLWVYIVAGVAFAGALWMLLLTIMK
jgi:hypothetical protein